MKVKNKFSAWLIMFALILFIMACAVVIFSLSDDKSEFGTTKWALQENYAFAVGNVPYDGDVRPNGVYTFYQTSVKEKTGPIVWDIYTSYDLYNTEEELKEAVSKGHASYCGAVGGYSEDTVYGSIENKYVYVHYNGLESSTGILNIQVDPMPANTSTATPTPEQSPAPTPSTDETAIRDILAGFYPSERIISIVTLGHKLEITIAATEGATVDHMPSNWSSELGTAQEASAAVKTAGEAENAVIYLADEAGNYLLSALNGRILYDTFEEHTGGVKDNPPTISLEEYNQIKTGMEYQEVFDIIGSRGTVTSEVDLGFGDEYYTATYVFDGEGRVGANAIIMFQGGKVESKAQSGLE